MQDELRFRDWVTEALANLDQPGPDGDAEPPAGGVEQVPAGGDAAGVEAAGEVVAGGMAQVQAGGVAAPAWEVPAPPPQVDEEDPMDFNEGDDQEDPDPPEGAMFDALLDLEGPAGPHVGSQPCYFDSLKEKH